MLDFGVNARAAPSFRSSHRTAADELEIGGTPVPASPGPERDLLGEEGQPLRTSILKVLSLIAAG
jgi:hypothetical protein